jgi:hypothetical protein
MRSPSKDLNGVVAAGHDLVTVEGRSVEEHCPEV